MLQNLQVFAKFQKFQKFQLDNLVDFEKCCKTRIYFQRSAPTQPKTSEHLPKICQNDAVLRAIEASGSRGALSWWGRLVGPGRAVGGGVVKHMRLLRSRTSSRSTLASALLFLPTSRTSSTFVMFSRVSKNINPDTFSLPYQRPKYVLPWLIQFTGVLARSKQKTNTCTLLEEAI